MESTGPHRVAQQLVVLVVVAAAIPLAAATIGTTFAYQATLSDPGGAVNGVRDLRITLYDAEAGGSVVAGPLDIDDVVVVDGRVQLELDFGDVFDGTRRWLGFEIRDGASTGGFSVLRPRQRLWAAPNVAHAEHAEVAAVAGTVPTAQDADTLDGVSSAALLEWGSLTGVPAGLDDGDDDTLGSLSCSTLGEVPFWNGVEWVCGTDRSAPYAGITVVGPVGSVSANGLALLNAMAAIPTPASADEAWLLIVEPGTYALGIASLGLKPWVDVAGSGQHITVITSSVCNLLGSDPVGTVNGASSAQLRNLTVENTCATVGMIGVSIKIPDTASYASIRDVTALTLGGTGAQGGAGLWIDGDATTIEDVTTEGSGGTEWNAGIVVRGDETLILDTVATGKDGDGAYGIALIGLVPGAEPHITLNRCSLKALNTTVGRGLWIESANADVEHVTSVGAVAIYVNNAAGDNTVGISDLSTTGNVVAQLSGGTLGLEIAHSRIFAFGTPTLEIDPGVSARVAATQLWGPAVAGSPVCAGVWDEYWSFYTSACP